MIICSSETSFDFRRITWRYIPEDGTLHNHRCDNIKSYKSFNLRHNLNELRFVASCEKTALIALRTFSVDPFFSMSELIWIWDIVLQRCKAERSERGYTIPVLHVIYIPVPIASFRHIFVYNLKWF
jgi:hypothetical protein